MPILYLLVRESVLTGVYVCSHKEKNMCVCKCAVYACMNAFIGAYVLINNIKCICMSNLTALPSWVKACMCICQICMYYTYTYTYVYKYILFFFCYNMFVLYAFLPFYFTFTLLHSQISTAATGVRCVWVTRNARICV